MNGIPAAGVADVQSRIAAIRSRIAELSPPAADAAFSLNSAPTSATVGAPRPASPAAATATPVVQRGATSAATEPVTVDSARLEQLLPAAGKRWATQITTAANEHGLDPGLLAALVEKESGFDPSARSHAGAIGLGQLMPGTAAGLGVDPTDPAQNLDGAARYLKEQLDRFGSADLALAAYNAGPGRVAQAGGVPRITETRNYVDRVLAAWERYR